MAVSKAASMVRSRVLPSQSQAPPDSVVSVTSYWFVPASLKLKVPSWSVTLAPSCAPSSKVTEGVVLEGAGALPTGVIENSRIFSPACAGSALTTPFPSRLSVLSTSTMPFIGTASTSSIKLP